MQQQSNINNHQIKNKRIMTSKPELSQAVLDA